MIDVEVIYATESEQIIFSVALIENSNIKDAILASNVLIKYPEIDLENIEVGVFSQKKNLDDELNAGDRVEIYRPLIADPKKIRRAKADIQKENKQFL